RRDDLRLAHDVDILLPLGGDEDLVAGRQLIQIAEDLAVDVVMRGERQVAGFAGRGRARVLANPLAQLLPFLPLVDAAVHVNRRNLDAAGLFGTGRGDGRRLVIAYGRQQMGRDV